MVNFQRKDLTIRVQILIISRSFGRIGSQVRWHARTSKNSSERENADWMQYKREDKQANADAETLSVVTEQLIPHSVLAADVYIALLRTERKLLISTDYKTVQIRTLCIERFAPLSIIRKSCNGYATLNITSTTWL